MDRRTYLATCGSSAAALVGALSGCWSRPAGDGEVVVYAALDREFSGPLLARFETETGASVAAKYDVESTKTVGLANAILAEKKRPLCDVFWNNEILHTLRLEKAGLLEPYAPAAAADYPASFRSPEGLWHGFAARARVLLVNKERLPKLEWPRSVDELAEPRWKGRAGLAKPLFGTTASHAAVLFARWGRERAEAFFRATHENSLTLSGNKQVATAVGRGQIVWGLTDTDDAVVEIENGSPVEIVYPDQESDQAGSLLIPNSLGIIRGCRHGALARKLVDFLLRGEVERELARGASAQFPLHRAVKERPRVEPQPPPRWMDADFPAAAQAWDEAARFLRDLYER